MTRDVYQLAQVFNESQASGITYVAPAETQRLKGSLVTPGKHVTLVGPSGSGKSTVAERALAAAGFDADRVLSFNARAHTGAQSIFTVLGAELGVGRTAKAVEPRLREFDLIKIEDVHRLSLKARTQLASRLKLWHESGIRVFMIGIAKTSDAILGHDPELAIRNDTWYLGTQSDTFMDTLMTQGERALNIKFDDATRGAAIRAARGSPSIFQAICRSACVEADVMRTAAEPQQVAIDLAVVAPQIAKQFDGRYIRKIVRLTQGRRSVHDVYFKFVQRAATSEGFRTTYKELDAAVVGTADPAIKGRVRSAFRRAIDSLPAVIEESGLDATLTYEHRTLRIDDPAFRFYLDHLDLTQVSSEVVPRRSRYEYDVAVSFAGNDRSVVQKFVEMLEERDLKVFYDFNQQAELWGKDLRRGLARIYGEQAQFMVICLSDDYPERDWTTFEYEVGRNAASKRTEDYLLPLIVGNRPPITGLPATYGFLSLQDQPMEKVADLLLEKLAAVQEISPSALRLRPAP
ncbi:TIR domain-containing protein [Promicromonospora sp. MEB111]|uniref:TIR domain-containing protein n=1 Tax=Promicromonospora sp. MEB111 TaxID=3040301 RepID=UPI00254CD449|nr:TIR domain-containing protein [Promicromonospora sp. MEB111]